jgi:cyanophycinase
MPDERPDLQAEPLPAAATALRGTPRGHLVVIGGGEDRERDKLILRRFVELAGGTRARIVVLTAASQHPDEMWKIYDDAFGELDVRERVALTIESREDANDERQAAIVRAATGVFMTGGDQKRLLALIGGTAIDSAMHEVLARGGAIAGTSAGASAMSEHMLAAGGRDVLPEKGSVSLACGLGYIQRVIIDQHFSERQRLGRLLAVVAQNPYLIGIGIDEDTALVIEPGRGLEVIGEGAVTLIDGRQMLSNFLDVDEREKLELVNVRLHLLPSGARYFFFANGSDSAIPRPLQEAVAMITSVSSPLTGAEPLAA